MALTGDDFLTRLQADDPGFWAYLQEHPFSLNKVTNLAEQYAGQAAAKGTKQYGLFTTAVQGLTSYTQYLSAAPADATDTTVDVTDPANDPYTAYLQQQAAEQKAQSQQDVRSLLQTFLQENQLPGSLMNFINDAIIQNKSFDQIVAELRQTPEYKAAYPENDIRAANGLSWMPEAQIRAYRDEAKQIAQATVGVSLSDADIAQNLLGKGKSLAEWESNLKTYAVFQKYGPAVKVALSQELGYQVDDARAYAMMSADTPTPELDAAYTRALMRGQPATLGLGLRPEEEAKLLEQYGISTEQAFKGYQGIVGELPAAVRFQAIENAINEKGNFPTGNDLFNDTPFATLFRAIQLGDQDALRHLQTQMAQEVGRFRSGGSVAQSGSGAAVGLLTAGQRAQS